MGKQCQTLYFGGSKITADGDCSHEIKRHLLLGRKVMTNLDSIFKSRDIALPTKVYTVKAMVIPVVMHACESWTIYFIYIYVTSFKTIHWFKKLKNFYYFTVPGLSCGTQDCASLLQHT